jgi:hypothetical protein
LNFPDFGRPVAETIDDDWIDCSARTGLLLRRLLAEFREGLVEDTRHLESIVEEPADRELLAELLSREPALPEPKKEIEACLSTLLRNHLTSKIKEIEQRLANAEPSSPSELDLMRERKALREMIGTDPRLP